MGLFKDKVRTDYSRAYREMNTKLLLGEASLRLRPDGKYVYAHDAQITVITYEMANSLIHSCSCLKKRGNVWSRKHK